jgi:high-affinity nickel-transport protein
VAVALVIGTIELSGLLARRLGAQGSFWSWWENIDIGTVGLIMAGLFVAAWVLALTIWRLGRIEERWDVRVSQRSGV